MRECHFLRSKSLRKPYWLNDAQDPPGNGNLAVQINFHPCSRGKDEGAVPRLTLVLGEVQVAVNGLHEMKKIV